MGISSTTLWRKLGSDTYLTYKEYILVVTEITKLYRKRGSDGFKRQSDRFKQIMSIMQDEHQQYR